MFDNLKYGIYRDDIQKNWQYSGNKINAIKRAKEIGEYFNTSMTVYETKSGNIVKEIKYKEN